MFGLWLCFRWCSWCDVLSVKTLPIFKLIGPLICIGKFHASMCNGYHTRAQDIQRCIHHGPCLKYFRILDSGGKVFFFPSKYIITVFAVFLAYPPVPKKSNFCSKSVVHSQVYPEKFSQHLAFSGSWIIWKLSWFAGIQQDPQWDQRWLRTTCGRAWAEAATDGKKQQIRL